MSSIAEVVLRIRARLLMTTTSFGTLLGVGHSQISRYEHGKATPGYVPLGRLLQLAEGAEKNVILDRIAELLGRKQVTELEATRELEKTGRYFEPLWATLSSAESGGLSHPPSENEPWDVILQTRPNLADLMKAVSELWIMQREVDASIPHVVRLWIDHDDTDPAVRQCFADAAKFLDVALTAKATRATPEHRRGKKLA